MDEMWDSRREEGAAEALRRSYRRVFSGPEGVRVLEDLSRRGFVRATTFHPESGRTAFNEGRRSLVLEILALARIDPGRGPGGASRPERAPLDAPADDPSDGPMDDPA